MSSKHGASQHLFHFIPNQGGIEISRPRYCGKQSTLQRSSSLEEMIRRPRSLHCPQKMNGVYISFPPERLAPIHLQPPMKDYNIDAAGIDAHPKTVRHGICQTRNKALLIENFETRMAAVVEQRRIPVGWSACLGSAARRDGSHRNNRVRLSPSETARAPNPG